MQLPDARYRQASDRLRNLDFLPLGATESFRIELCKKTSAATRGTPEIRDGQRYGE